MPIARIALIGARQGWCQQFTEAAFRLHWTEGRPMSEPENIAQALASAGQDVERVQQLAASDEIKEALKQQAQRATARCTGFLEHVREACRRAHSIQQPDHVQELAEVRRVFDG